MGDAIDAKDEETEDGAENGGENGGAIRDDELGVVGVDVDDCEASRVRQLPERMKSWSSCNMLVRLWRLRDRKENIQIQTQQSIRDIDRKILIRSGHRFISTRKRLRTKIDGQILVPPI